MCIEEKAPFPEAQTKVECKNCNKKVWRRYEEHYYTPEHCFCSFNCMDAHFCCKVEFIREDQHAVGHFFPIYDSHLNMDANPKHWCCPFSWELSLNAPTGWALRTHALNVWWEQKG